MPWLLAGGLIKNVSGGMSHNKNSLSKVTVNRAVPARIRPFVIGLSRIVPSMQSECRTVRLFSKVRNKICWNLRHCVLY